jgi:hypothetical protein
MRGSFEMSDVGSTNNGVVSRPAVRPSTTGVGRLKERIRRVPRSE